MKVIKDMTLEELREHRESLETRYNEIVSAERDLTDEDAEKIESLQEKISEASDAIVLAERMERARALKKKGIIASRKNRNDQPTPDTVEEASKRFCWGRFLLGALDRRHEGVEKEIVEEGHNESARYKPAQQMSNPLPAAFMEVVRGDGSSYHRRDPISDGLNTVDDTQGKELIQTQYGSLIPALRPRLLLPRLGATTLTGLTGPVEIPRETDLSNANWRDEYVDAEETASRFDTISLTPKSLSAWSDFTKELLFQATISPSVQTYVRQSLENAVRRKLDDTFINGATGAATNIPKGILERSIINADLDTDYTPTWKDLVDFWKELRVENADVENMKWLMNPQTAAKLMSTPKVTGTDSVMLMDTPRSGIMGYDTVLSNHVPSDINLGAGAADASALIFGNWADVLVAQWAGIDVIADNVTKARKAAIEVIIHSWWDSQVLHDESFAAALNV